MEKFFEVLQMIVEWNQHMKDVFIPSCVSCLDESIIIWTIKFTLPGWMFVPRNTPHKGISNMLNSADRVY